jgi:hypothetical protein
MRMPDGLSDNMKRMLRNACACGQRGLAVHGRAEMSVAKALERRGHVRLDRAKGRLDDFTGQRIPVLAFVVKHDEEHCNCHECRTVRWRRRMSSPETDVVGAQCLDDTKVIVFEIVEDLGFSDDRGRLVTITPAGPGDGNNWLQTSIHRLFPPLL